MLRDVAVARIQQGLGFRADRQTEIVLALQEEQRDLESGKTLPWFLLVEDATLSLTAGSHSIPLPDDFIRPYDLEPLRYTVSGESGYRFVEFRDLTQILQSYSSYNPGGPQAIALRNNSLYVEPIADVDYTITWTYYAHADLLDSNIENAWLANFPEVLIGGAGLRMAYDTRDKDAVAIFTAMQGKAKTSLFNEIIAREEAAKRRSKGRGL